MHLEYSNIILEFICHLLVDCLRLYFVVYNVNFLQIIFLLLLLCKSCQISMISSRILRIFADIKPKGHLNNSKSVIGTIRN